MYNDKQEQIIEAGSMKEQERTDNVTADKDAEKTKENMKKTKIIFIAPGKDVIHRVSTGITK